MSVILFSGNGLRSMKMLDGSMSVFSRVWNCMSSRSRAAISTVTGDLG
ncbi:hypothetical protein Barb7_02903 [Bacteroidales bacterium Barb7]|nr:hypothetical protein Barb7_02903 [Bacteroidales bacterium Barb7]